MTMSRQNLFSPLTIRSDLKSTRSVFIHVSTGVVENRGIIQYNVETSDIIWSDAVSSDSSSPINLDPISTKRGFMVFSKGRALSPPAKPVFWRARFFSAVSLFFLPLFLFSSSPLWTLFHFFFGRSSDPGDRNSCHRGRIGPFDLPSRFHSRISTFRSFREAISLLRRIIIFRVTRKFIPEHTQAGRLSSCVSPFSKTAPKRKRSYLQNARLSFRYDTSSISLHLSSYLRLHVGVLRAKRRQFLTRRDAELGTNQ